MNRRVALDGTDPDPQSEANTMENCGVSFHQIPDQGQQHDRQHLLGRKRNDGTEHDGKEGSPSWIHPLQGKEPRRSIQSYHGHTTPFDSMTTAIIDVVYCTPIIAYAPTGVKLGSDPFRPESLHRKTMRSYNTKNACNSNN